MIVGSSGFKPNQEGEALHHRAKNLIRWDPGIRKKAKRRFWRRMRSKARQAARRWAQERDEFGQS